MTDDSTNPQGPGPSQEVIVPPKQDAEIEPRGEHETTREKPGRSSGTSSRVTEELQAFMATFQSQSAPRSGMGVLFEKFTEEHINKYLDGVQRDDDHAYEMAKTNRWFYFAYVVVFLIVLGVAVIYLLPRDKAFLESMIEILVILAGGLGAGYGLKSRGR